MIKGRVWKFGENINTDLMVPNTVLYESEEAQTRAVFSANRPGWTDAVAAGDIIVAGRNFGMGSSRPGARSLRNLGVACVIADSINGLFTRNSVNFGFLALECPDVAAAFEEGEVAEIDIEQWSAANPKRGIFLPIKPVPEQLLALMRGGGVYPHLEQLGLIKPKSPAAGSAGTAKG